MGLKVEKVLQMKTELHQRRPGGAIGEEVGCSQAMEGGPLEPPAPLAQEEPQIEVPQQSCERSRSQTEAAT